MTTEELIISTIIIVIITLIIVIVTWFLSKIGSKVKKSRPPKIKGGPPEDEPYSDYY